MLIVKIFWKMNPLIMEKCAKSTNFGLNLAIYAKGCRQIWQNFHSGCHRKCGQNPSCWFHRKVFIILQSTNSTIQKCISFYILSAILDRKVMSKMDGKAITLVFTVFGTCHLLYHWQHSLRPGILFAELKENINIFTLTHSELRAKPVLLFPEKHLYAQNCTKSRKLHDPWCLTNFFSRKKTSNGWF